MRALAAQRFAAPHVAMHAAPAATARDAAALSMRFLRGLPARAALLADESSAIHSHWTFMRIYWSFVGAFAARLARRRCRRRRRPVRTALSLRRCNRSRVTVYGRIYVCQRLDVFVATCGH